MHHSHSIFHTFFFVCILFVSCFFRIGFADAATYEVTGWGWAADDNRGQGFCTDMTPPSDGITDCPLSGLGWVSFSSKSDLSPIPYGVFIDSVTGNFNGYAWSDNFGWITYQASDMQTCATNPGDNCPHGPAPKAHIGLTTDLNGIITGGTGIVTGWLRMCSVFVSGCTGARRPVNETGGWDGWISLSGSEYGLLLDTQHGPVMKFQGPVTTGFFTGTPYCASCFAWSGGFVTPSFPNDRSAGFGWGMNFGGLTVTLLPETAVTYLSFWSDQPAVLQGQPATLRWIAGGDVTTCLAGGDWSGPKTYGFVAMEATTPIMSPKTYTLQCFGPNPANSDDDTPLLTVDIAVNMPFFPADGVCGTAKGMKSTDKPAVHLCEKGVLLSPPGVVSNGTNWEWICEGVNGGNSSDLCSAPKTKRNPFYIQF